MTMIIRLIFLMCFLDITLTPFATHADKTRPFLPPPKSSSGKQQVVQPKPVEQPFVMPRYQPRHLDKQHDDSDALYRNYWKGNEQYAPKH